MATENEVTDVDAANAIIKLLNDLAHQGMDRGRLLDLVLYVAGDLMKQSKIEIDLDAPIGAALDSFAAGYRSREEPQS